tara:strand:+ start:408 stop:884 length:477 start_codon:yes stop_codon:yes gene_type:complete
LAYYYQNIKYINTNIKDNPFIFCSVNTSKVEFVMEVHPTDDNISDFTVTEDNLPSDPFFIYYNINITARLDPPPNIYFQTFSQVFNTTNDEYDWPYLGAIFDSNNKKIPITEYDSSTTISDLKTVVLINPAYIGQVKVPDNFMKSMAPIIKRLEKFKI